MWDISFPMNKSVQEFDEPYSSCFTFHSTQLPSKKHGINLDRMLCEAEGRKRGRINADVLRSFSKTGLSSMEMRILWSMGTVWAYRKGVPLLGVPGETMIWKTDRISRSFILPFFLRTVQCTTFHKQMHQTNSNTYISMNRPSGLRKALCLAPESVGKYPTWLPHSSREDCFQCSAARKVNILPEAFTMCTRIVNNLPGASKMYESTMNIDIPAPQPMSEVSVNLQHSETSRSCSIGFCHPCELKKTWNKNCRDAIHTPSAEIKALFGRIPWLHEQLLGEVQPLSIFLHQCTMNLIPSSQV